MVFKGTQEPCASQTQIGYRKGKVGCFFFLLGDDQIARVILFQQSMEVDKGFPTSKVAFQKPPVGFHDCWRVGTCCLASLYT